MPGYQPQQIANNVMTGNNAVIMVGDEVVMFAQTSGSQVSYGTEQLYGVGTAKPQEVQQLRVSPSFSLDALTLTQHGMNLYGAGTRLEYILAGKSFNIHIVDGVSKTTLYTHVNAKAQNVNTAVPANAPLRSTYAFLSLDVIDKNGNSLIDAGDNAIAVTATTANLVFAAAA
jgi:hypothetical protein